MQQCELDMHRYCGFLHSRQQEKILHSAYLTQVSTLLYKVETWDYELLHALRSDFHIYVTKFNKVFSLFTKVSQVSGKIRHSPSFSIDLFRLPPLWIVIVYDNHSCDITFVFSSHGCYYLFLFWSAQKNGITHHVNSQNTLEWIIMCDFVLLYIPLIKSHY